MRSTVPSAFATIQSLPRAANVVPGSGHGSCHNAPGML